MVKGMVKAVAYLKAPARTFALLHPFKALKYAGAFFILRSLLGSRRERERSTTNRPS